MTRSLAAAAAICAIALVAGPGRADNVELRWSQAESGAGGGRVNAHLAPGMGRFGDLTPAQQQARKRLMRGAPVPLAAMRELADLGDGAAAFAFGKRLETLTRDRPELTADAAHYFGIALATERGGAMGRFAAALARIDPGDTTPARLSVLKDILLAYAAAGDTVALRTALERHAARRPFGSLEAEIDRLVLSPGARARPEFALHLASVILQRRDAGPGDLARARAHLARAMASDRVRTRALASNLLQVHEARLARARDGGAS